MYALMESNRLQDSEATRELPPRPRGDPTVDTQPEAGRRYERCRIYCRVGDVVVTSYGKTLSRDRRRQVLEFDDQSGVPSSPACGP